MVARNRLTLHSPLAEFLRRKPVTVMPDALLREVVALMAAEKVGSVVVVEPESGRPMGIFTLRDLLHKVALHGLDLDTMILSLISDSHLILLNWRAKAYQAEMLLARHGIHHLIVVDAAGRLVGVISQSDILDVQRGNAKALSMTIREARDMHVLEMAADEAQQVAKRMLSEGAAAEQVMQTLSTLNDLLVMRVVELTRRDFTLPPVPWCWLAFGSEGRFEQTLATDQDNGLMFDCKPEEVEATRQAFLPFAAVVNDRLDTCGFPLCKGNIMASNPELCLSLAEWRQRFADWMRSGDAQAMLNAVIFFDFRPLYGQEALAEALHLGLQKSVPQEGLFLRFMAETALKARPPLGLIRDFVFDDDKDFPNTLDLKAFGSRLFVDAARILALAHGVSETSTIERLRTLVRRGALVGEDVEAMVDGFLFIQKLRLLHQRENLPTGAENRIDPDQLNELDRAVLKMALKQSKKLQDVLQLAYHL